MEGNVQNGAAGPVAEGEPEVPVIIKKVRGHNRKKAPSSSAQTELVDAEVEKEFLTLMAKMKKTHLGQHLVYQINNYVEGIECTFRVSRDQAETPFTSNFGVAGQKVKEKKELKELTPEEKARLDARREKRRAARKKNLEKKIAAQAAAKAQEAAGDGDNTTKEP